ncbi:hypothetical protein IJJ37_02750 [Candidatus Saccharibacteria bacterium]|nr:hypothetical protein [Candidatus Saccharibacteria bacterium]
MPFKELLSRKRKGTKVSAPDKSVAKVEQPRKYTYDELLNAESALGRTLFGPIPAGHQREFFALRRNVWMWYENWFDEKGHVEELILRYEVRPDGVYKKPGDGSYVQIHGDELKNFATAVRSYYSLVKTQLYC